MNYRHAFHAGNFADLVKHACLLSVLSRLTAQATPLSVIDTHAGAGLYDLAGEEAAKSGEAAAGIVRLMADAGAPVVFEALKAAVGKANPAGGLRFYPGSPLLIAQALRKSDTLIACETRPDDLDRLRRNLIGPNLQVFGEDGYGAALKHMQAGRATLVHIDPPFEQADDYARIAATVAGVLRRNNNATIMVWLPLKDLETFDAFLRTLESMQLPQTLVAETRLRPLSDPMRMNGCALVILNDPQGTEQDAMVAGDWIARTLGEPGGEARIWRL